MTKMSRDPRDEECSVNYTRKHKWSRHFKDKISKTKFVAILRCRFCARYVCVEFERVVLPSGRVTIKERAFETTKDAGDDEATVGLHESEPSDGELQAIEVEGVVQHTANGRLHT